ncbi:hypothetical protein [Paracoccus sp. M683]|uniref:hypothetical protein n=1 Tax=Paracoccus sp. M683 TaxID=2594268 RepID=UPI00163DCA84|nr:hypothetical protein [Paracoccus sp. M683]
MTLQIIDIAQLLAFVVVVAIRQRHRDMPQWIAFAVAAGLGVTGLGVTGRLAA